MEATKNEYEKIFDKKKITTENLNKEDFLTEYIQENAVVRYNTDFKKMAQNACSDKQMNGYEEIVNAHFYHAEALKQLPFLQEYEAKELAIKRSGKPPWLKKQKLKKLQEQKKNDVNLQDISVESIKQRREVAQKESLALLKQLNDINVFDVSVEGEALSRMNDAQRQVAMNDPDILGLLHNGQTSSPRLIGPIEQYDNEQIVNAFKPVVQTDDASLANIYQERKDSTIANALESVCNRLNDHKNKDDFYNHKIDYNKPFNPSKFSILKVAHHAMNLLNKYPGAKLIVEKKNGKQKLIEQGAIAYEKYRTFLDVKTSNGKAAFIDYGDKLSLENFNLHNPYKTPNNEPTS